MRCGISIISLFSVTVCASTVRTAALAMACTVHCTLYTVHCTRNCDPLLATWPNFNSRLFVVTYFHLSKPSGYYMYRTVVTICTTKSTFCPHSVFMCFVWMWEQTAIISLYSINWLVFITETVCVYSAVQTGSLYIIQVMCFVWIWEQTAIISLYSINWLVCITERESVYCAVRTGYLNTVEVAFSTHRVI